MRQNMSQFPIFASIVIVTLIIFGDIIIMTLIILADIVVVSR